MNYKRMSNLITYFFYKNFNYTIFQIIFLFANGYSSQTIFPDWYLTNYNMLWTTYPICGYASAVDKDVLPLKSMDGEYIR